MDASDEFLLRAALARSAWKAGQRDEPARKSRTLFAQLGADTDAEGVAMTRAWSKSEDIMLTENCDDTAGDLALMLSRPIEQIRARRKELGLRSDKENLSEKRRQNEEDHQHGADQSCKHR
jgi:hypothetical protein